MSDKIDKILEKIEHIAEDVVNIKIDVATNTADMKTHIYRTRLAEENIELVRAQQKEDAQELKRDIEPIKTHVSMMRGALKLVTIIAVIVGIISGIYSIIF